jgi:hypothetical protein
VIASRAIAPKPSPKTNLGGDILSPYPEWMCCLLGGENPAKTGAGVGTPLASTASFAALKCVMCHLESPPQIEICS